MMIFLDPGKLPTNLEGSLDACILGSRQEGVDHGGIGQLEVPSRGSSKGRKDYMGLDHPKGLHFCVDDFIIVVGIDIAKGSNHVLVEGIFAPFSWFFDRNLQNGRKQGRFLAILVWIPGSIQVNNIAILDLLSQKVFDRIQNLLETGHGQCPKDLNPVAGGKAHFVVVIQVFSTGQTGISKSIFGSFFESWWWIASFASLFVVFVVVVVVVVLFGWWRHPKGSLPFFLLGSLTCIA